MKGDCDFSADVDIFSGLMFLLLPVDDSIRVRGPFSIQNLVGKWKESKERKTRHLFYINVCSM